MVTPKRYVMLVGLVFCVAVAAQLLLERTGGADSIGVWYTLYSALVYTAIIVVIVAIGLALTRKRRRDNRLRRGP
jgi:hypothetical protein